MTINDKQYYIYYRSTGDCIPVSKEEFDNYYREINAFRQRQQYHHKCVCPANKRLSCDMDCFTCPYRRVGDTISLDYCMTDDEGNEKAMVDTIPAPSPLVEDLVTDRILLAALVARLTEIMPLAFDIINMRLEGMTDTAISKAIGIPRKTFTDRWKKAAAILKSEFPDIF
ncbi:MAG: hypothetical protein ACI4Q6_02260 [Huintestinicola sp.]